MPENGPGSRPGPYLIQLDGLPAGYTWKDLKDDIRHKATHSVWTDVSVLVRGHHSFQRGYIKLKLKSEAVDAYHYLSTHLIAKKRLFVELWDITDSPPQFLHRNFDPNQNSMSTQPREVQQIAQDNSSWNHIPIQCEYQQAPMIHVTAQIPSQPYVSQPMINVGGQQLTQAQYAQWYQAYQAQLARQAPMQQQATPVAHYGTSASGLPVNMRNGGAITEARSVFVGKLNYKAEESEVEAHFARAGRVLSCKIQRDPRDRKSRGNAKIEYGSTEEAAKAVQYFNKTEFMNMTLHVRLDRDTTTVAPPPAADPRPLIVDSSMGSRSRSSK